MAVWWLCATFSVDFLGASALPRRPARECEGVGYSRSESGMRHQKIRGRYRTIVGATKQQKSLKSCDISEDHSDLVVVPPHILRDLAAVVWYWADLYPNAFLLLASRHFRWVIRVQLWLKLAIHKFVVDYYQWVWMALSPICVKWVDKCCRDSIWQQLKSLWQGMCRYHIDILQYMHWHVLALLCLPSEDVCALCCLHSAPCIHQRSRYCLTRK